MNPLVEVLELVQAIEKRLRRLETRFTSYAHNTGVDVHRNTDESLEIRALPGDVPGLHLTHPGMSVGHVMYAARLHRLPDGAPVYLNGRLIFRLRILE